MSTKMEASLQSELTECLVNARHWLLCVGANLIGDICWGHREPQSCWRKMAITNSICYGVCWIQFSHSVLSDTLQRMHCSTPGFPALQQLQKLAQTHVHQVSDAIQPSHPLASPSPPTFNPSQHQGLFQRVSSLHLVAKSIGASASASILLMNVQDWFPLGLTGWISLQSKELSRVFSNTTVQKHQFFSSQLSLCSNSHIHTWLMKYSTILAWEIPWTE